MEILVTLPTGLAEMLIDKESCRRLADLSSITYNPHNEQFTPEELRDRLKDIEICITGWGTPTLDSNVLAEADNLKLVAHIGGSIATVASPELYNQDVAVTSANHTMARYVAEAILTMSLAGLRDLPRMDRKVRAGNWPSDNDQLDTLFDRDIGFIGLGDVGQNLIDLLAPFDASVTIYDPYIDANGDVFEKEWVRQGDLKDALEADVVSIHASLTEETIGLIGGEELARIPDGALLVNCARGPIVDEEALIDELASRRIRAALDVFDREPLPEESKLNEVTTVLTPHVAGSPGAHKLAPTVVDEIERFLADEALEGEIPFEKYDLMTRDHLRE